MYSYPSGSRFEGCGQEGPLRNIFLAEFHHLEGPRIRCQVGTENISKDIFDAINIFIIPKQQLSKQRITLNVLGLKVSGCPIVLENTKYKRNQFIFNVCFVCHSWSRTVQYEPAIQKLIEYLMNLELESEFVSVTNNTNDIEELMQRIFEDLNECGRCLVSVRSENAHQLQLKVNQTTPVPPTIEDHEVPLLLIDPRKYNIKSWDLTTQELLEYIDGFNHVTRIAAMAAVDNNLVKNDVSNLVYHGLAKILPLFSYADSYVITPKINRLRNDSNFKFKCIQAVRLPNKVPKLKDIYTFSSYFSYGSSVKDILSRHNPRLLGFCVRKLIQFFLLNDIIRKISKIPILLSEASRSEEDFTIHFNGLSSLDEICIKTGRLPSELEEFIEKDPSIFCINK